MLVRAAVRGELERDDVREEDAHTAQHAAAHRAHRGLDVRRRRLAVGQQRHGQLPRLRQGVPQSGPRQLDVTPARRQAAARVDEAEKKLRDAERELKSAPFTAATLKAEVSKLTAEEALARKQASVAEAAATSEVGMRPATRAMYKVAAKKASALANEAGKKLKDAERKPMNASVTAAKLKAKVTKLTAEVASAL